MKINKTWIYLETLTVKEPTSFLEILYITTNNCFCFLHFTFDWNTTYVFKLTQSFIQQHVNLNETNKSSIVTYTAFTTFGMTMVCPYLCGWKTFVHISVHHRLQLVSIWRPLGRLQAGWSSETHNHSPAPGSGSGSGQGKAPDCWLHHLPCAYNRI